MTSKPIIAISTGHSPEGDVFMRRSYALAVKNAGGIPIVFTPETDVNEAIRLCSGVILSGGCDLAPECYGLRGYDPTLLGYVEHDRDSFELELARLAYSRELPILAICRGLQLLNVALGGSLHIDIPNHRQELSRSEPSHAVELAPESHLGAILGRRELCVNSFHHQALDRVADTLTVTAHAPDGIIEAVEAPSRRFCIGVQWHPEDMPEFAPLFEVFVKQSRKGY